MEKWLIFDIVACLILVLSFIAMSGKGVVKCVYKIISIIGAIVLVLMLAEPVSDMLSSTVPGQKIDEAVYNVLIPDKEYNEETGSVERVGGEENLNLLPKFLGRSVSEITGGALAPAVSGMVKKLLCAVILYFIIKLILYLIFMLIEGIFKLPGLNSINRLLGGCIGLLSGAVLIFILCGLLSFDVSNSVQIREIIDKTYIVKYFYDYNILMNLFLI